MATILTGTDVSLVIDSDSYDAQAISATFSYTPDRQVLETLSGPTYKTLTKPYSLDITMYSDWGATTSLCDALAQAALTAPDTSLNFTLTVTGPDENAVITGKVFPEVPSVTGEGTSASQVSVTLTGDRNTAPTITTTSA